MYYFGAPWQGAPEKPCATPVGAPCLICTLPFAPDDRGVLGGQLQARRSGDIQGRYIIAHRECYMMDTIGHEHGVCSCTRGERTPQQKRADAIALWLWLAGG